MQSRLKIYPGGFNRIEKKLCEFFELFKKLNRILLAASANLNR